MIKREHYLEQIRPFYESDLVKIITGVRRCGKSVILESIRDEISQKTDNIIYLNFEKVDIIEQIPSYISLVRYVDSRRKAGKCYLFLDEIQILDKWQLALKDLRLKDISIFVTGSNSALLSGEFITYLAGREVSFRVRPFVFKEIQEYAAQLGKVVTPSEYLVFGGFPARFEYNSESECMKYLSELKETIVLKDLILHYRIKNEILFRKIVNFVLKNNSRVFSSKSVFDYIRNEQLKCSVNTILKYLKYLEEAYLIDKIEQYSTKAKRDLIYYSKVYLCDVGFNSISRTEGVYDLEHNLENIVYNELKYMGYDVKTYKLNEKEVDFRAVKNGKTYYIQVSYMASNPQTYEREFSAFKSLDNNNQKIIITLDPVDLSTSVIKHIKFEDFLKLKEL